MKYNPRNKSITIGTKNLDSIYLHAIRAIAQIRVMENLPMTPYEQDGPLLAHDFAMISIVEMCIAAGIDMGVESAHDYNKISVEGRP